MCEKGVHQLHHEKVLLHQQKNQDQLEKVGHHYIKAWHQKGLFLCCERETQDCPGISAAASVAAAAAYLAVSAAAAAASPPALAASASSAAPSGPGASEVPEQKNVRVQLQLSLCWTHQTK